MNEKAKKEEYCLNANGQMHAFEERHIIGQSKNKTCQTLSLSCIFIMSVYLSFKLKTGERSFGFKSNIENFEGVVSKVPLNRVGIIPVLLNPTVKKTLELPLEEYQLIYLCWQ